MEQNTEPRRTRGLTMAQATNLREEEQCAFVHAVALALQSSSKLVSIHANDEQGALARMPRAVELLTRWGALPSGAADADEERLGMRHERIVDNCCDDPVDTLVRAIRGMEPELLVGTTSGREGVARAMLGSVAEALALHVRAPALLFPVGCRSFVSEETGRIGLRRLLVAAGDYEAAEVGLTQAIWFSDLAGAEQVDVEVLHVEDGSAAPALEPPQRPGARFRLERARGSIESALLSHAEGNRADLIVMATRGHDSLRDVLLGSHAERVLRRAPCPVLSVPIHEMHAVR